MVDSIRPSFPECIKALCENVRLDPHFQEFYFWAKSNGIPVIVLSSGMTPVIRALLAKAIGDDAKTIDIVCNDVVDRPPKTKGQPGGWNVRFHDSSDFGHDKSLTIRPYAEHFANLPCEPRPTLLYAGDGVSDLSAARETDLLFAKRGRGKFPSCDSIERLRALTLQDLVTYCEREKLPFTVFDDWSSILEKTRDIL